MKGSLGLMLIFLLISCSSGGESGGPVMAENLKGTWSVIDAMRNNRPALSLENSEFYINDSLFSTNFLPDRNAYPYSYDGKKISLLDKKNSVFHVSRKASDTLTFRTEIKSFDFIFTAVKKQNSDET